MLEKTNMDAIRALAKAFLNFKVEYQYGFAIHPYRVMGEEGTPAFEKWKANLSKAIDSVNNVQAILLAMNPAWHMMFLHEAMPYLSRKTFTECFIASFIDAEHPTLGSSLSIDELIDMFKACDATSLMDKDDRKIYKKLPNVVTIYRGVGEEEHLKSLSWTLLPNVAEMFATRLFQQGKVYTAVIEKKHILAYFGGLREAEVIVDPNYLKDIKLFKDMSIRFQ